MFPRKNEQSSKIIKYQNLKEKKDTFPRGGKKEKNTFQRVWWSICERGNSVCGDVHGLPD